MKHFEVWIQIVTLIVGTGVLFYTWQLHNRFRYPFLRPMWWCFLFLNLSFLMDAISRYLFVNFFENLMLFKTSFYAEKVDPFAGVFYVGLVYYVIVLFQSFHHKDVPQWLGRLFVGLAAFIVLRNLMGLFVEHPGTVQMVIHAIYVGLYVLLLVTFYLVTGRFVMASYRLEDRARARLLAAFGSFYLCGHILLLLSAVFSGPRHSLVSQLIYLLYNVFPFVWYTYYISRVGNGPAITVDGSAVDLFCAGRGVSKRQREVIGLILDGKSNKEIADALFIAPHTVKNHLYSVYQKLGVKSRFELVSLILRFVKK